MATNFSDRVHVLTRILLFNKVGVNPACQPQTARLNIISIKSAQISCEISLLVISYNAIQLLFLFL